MPAACRWWRSRSRSSTIGSRIWRPTRKGETHDGSPGLYYGKRFDFDSGAADYRADHQEYRGDPG